MGIKSTQIYDFGKELANPSPGDEIVITGISGRFPQSCNVSEFFNNLLNKRDLLSETPNVWRRIVRIAPLRIGALKDHGKFDAGFFGIHHHQAEALDPACRILLEIATETIMDAGLNPFDLKGTNTGVFIATNFQESELPWLYKKLDSPSFGITGNLRSVLAEQISYYFQLEGPVVTLDSACCGSGYALEHAFMAIRSGRCENALVGGVNLVLCCNIFEMYCRLDAIDRIGKNKIFDEESQGYVRSESISLVFLQKLRNSKRIYAQILHTKTNSDGFKTEGIMHPSAESKAKLIQEVCQEAYVDSTEINYVESHATGTKAGDPIEIEAIEKSFCQNRKTPLFIGTVKSNVGHSESASGLSSLIKVVLGMEFDRIPPNINCLNERKDIEAFHNNKISIIKENLCIKDEKFIGINNSGFGGTNSYALIKKMKSEFNNNNGFLPKQRLVCVSARNEHSLKTILANIHINRKNTDYISLLQHLFRNDIDGFQYRGFTILSDTQDDLVSHKRFIGVKPRVGICLTGSSNHYANMVDDFSKIPVLSKTMKRINDVLNSKARILSHEHTLFFKLFAIQITLIECLKLLEIPINYVSGGPSGILANAYARDVITLDQLCRIALQFLRESKINNGNQEHRIQKYLVDNFKERTTAVPTFQVSSESYLTNNQPPFSIVTSCDGLHCTTHNINSLHSFLTALGRLHEMGTNLNLEKLYPMPNYPIKAPLISPLFNWNHQDDWFVVQSTCHADSRTEVINISVDSLDEDWNFLLCHCVDDQSFVPNTLFIYLVWEVFLKISRSLMCEATVLFENVRFYQPLFITTENLQFSIQFFKVSKRFEISHLNVLLASGSIKIPKLVHDEPTKYEHVDNVIVKSLHSDEIYRQLNLQRYQYKGQFRVLEKANFEGTQALIQWNNNWTIFLNQMMTIKLLREHSTDFVVPTSIDRLLIDPSQQTQNSAIVYSRNGCNIIRTPAAEARGISLTPILKNTVLQPPILQSYKFIPYTCTLTEKESLRVNLRIILENTKVRSLKTVEVFEAAIQSSDDLLSTRISLLLEEFGIQDKTVIFCSEMFNVSKVVVQRKTVFDIEKDTNLVVLSDMSKRVERLSQILSKLQENSYVLLREQENCPQQVFDNISDAKVITIHHSSAGVTFLLKKVGKYAKPYVISINSGFDWISDLQCALRNYESVLLLVQNNPISGIIGFLNCLKLEYGKLKISCIFIMDDGVTFDSESSFYQNQLKKSLLMNVLKNGEWGTYLHVNFEMEKSFKCKHFIGTVTKGNLSSFHWAQGPLNSDQYFVAHVHYVGLNSKDVMIGCGNLNVKSDKYANNCNLNVGLEFSGINSRNERIMGMVTDGALSNLVKTNKFLTWKVPDKWSLEDAATVPISYFTVLYSLLMVGEIKPGQSILIHGASGGIGQSAINVALYYKCEIFITVGSPVKQNVLKQLYPSLKDSHIGNSRDTTFQQMIMKETNGKGVDIIINYLREEKLLTSLRCLAPNGKFIELGKQDSILNNNINLSSLSKNRTFAGVHLDHIYNDRLEVMHKFQNIMYKGLDLGYVKPIQKQVFPKNRVREAFRLVASGKHTGKVIIKIKTDETNKTQMFAAMPKFYCNSDKVYIIVGGMGGFGLQLTEWLIKRGASRIVIVTHSNTRTDYQNFKLDVWKEFGVSIVISYNDLTNIKGCNDLIIESSKLGTIWGIFNLAAVLNDAIFENQTEEKFISVLAPKAYITENLDTISRELCPDLKYFVVFSSLSSGVGIVGQTNYGMANSITERICEMRKRDGFPGLAIQWGSVADVGLLAGKSLSSIESASGISGQKLVSCLEVLDMFLTQNEPVVSSHVMVKMVKNKGESADLISGIVKILGYKSEHVSLHSPLSELGVDSITSVEVKHFLEGQFEMFKSIQELQKATLQQLKDEAYKEPEE